MLLKNKLPSKRVRSFMMELHLGWPLEVRGIYCSPFILLIEPSDIYYY